jgi:hypothetical protein
VSGPTKILLVALLGGCSAAPIDVATLAPTSLTSNLVAHWRFDDGSGTRLRDDSGNGRDGTVSGGAWTAGRFGGGMHFQSGDIVTVPGFPFATASWSVSLWTRIGSDELAANDNSDFTALVSTEIVFKGGWEVNAALRPNDMRYHFGYYVGPAEKDYASIDCRCVVPDRWVHLAAVVDDAASAFRLYVDGALRAEAPMQHTILPGTETLYIARWEPATPPRQLTGALDDVAIYNRALVAQEVAYLATVPAPDPH